MRTYISLFSGAGIGCFGFTEQGFECIATNEIIQSRLNIQKFNKKCRYQTGYINGDISDQKTKDQIFTEIKRWQNIHKIGSVDVIVATPPCQGMSTVNYKKKDEKSRNSLVVEAIKMIDSIQPKVFVFENVRAFIKTICTDVDGNDKPIGETIKSNLSNNYRISWRVINFKDFGVPSSRPRTLVIGTRKDLRNITPLNLFPKRSAEITVRDAIGDLVHLEYGESDPTDILHFARPFPEYMLPWIKDIKEGESALDNPKETRPYLLKNGKRQDLKSTHINNKYRRLYWDRPGACIHTRNDIICSQDTIHPSDNRVLSIRELMRLMTIPDNFIWNDEINTLSRDQFLKNSELNIRRCIGEAVPTRIMETIAGNINLMLDYSDFVDSYDKSSFSKNDLTEEQKNNYYILSYIDESLLSDKKTTGSFYTPQCVVFDAIKDFAVMRKGSVRILEPAVGLGAFIPQLVSLCYNADEILIDVIDINPEILSKLKEYISMLKFDKRVKINYICADFLEWKPLHTYDIVASNPPFVKLNKKELSKYNLGSSVSSSNAFALFAHKLRALGEKIVLVVPKSFIMAAEYQQIRNEYENISIVRIVDYGVKYFKDVFVEILSLTFDADHNGDAVIENKAENNEISQKQGYIFHDRLWMLYRDKWFDDYISSLELDVFDYVRDRQITNKHMKNEGKIRILRAKNILDSGEIISIPGYDRFIDDPQPYKTRSFMNSKAIIMPNFTYNTRASILPDNCLANGSIAYLIPKNKRPEEIDILLYSTNDFRKYYAIVMNKAKFTLNIDNCTAYYIGVKKR